MATPNLLGISGSLRAEATNTKLVREAARLFGDATFTLADINLPLFDADAEAETGIPSTVQLLAEQIAAADAIVVSTPEYNKGPSGALKNALDWASRVGGAPWKGTPVAVMSASSGRAGGERAQLILRGFLTPFRPRLISGPEMHLAASNSQFDENGHLTSEIYLETLQELMNALRTEIR